MSRRGSEDGQRLSAGRYQEVVEDEDESAWYEAANTEVVGMLAMAKSTDPSEVISSMRHLADLSYCGEGKRRIVEQGGLEVVIGVLRGGDRKAQTCAAVILRHLTAMDRIKREIGEMEGIPLLLELASSGEDGKSVEEAVWTLSRLSILDENCMKIADYDGVATMVKVLGQGTPKAKLWAAVVLRNLADIDSLKKEIGVAGAIPPLIDLACHGDAESIEEAMGALSNLSILDENCKLIASGGGIDALVGVLESGLPEAKMWAGVVLRNVADLDELKRVIRTSNAESADALQMLSGLSLVE